MRSPSSSQPVGPSAPVDVFTPPEAPESRAWRPVSLIPLAAFCFAVVAWGVTGFLAWQSESKGIAGATVAMFPTGFGAAGLVVRAQELRRARPGAVRLLAVSFGGGLLAMALFAFFMSAIWPAL
jgi:hypothetical protein